MVLMNLSGVYRQEKFWRDEAAHWLELEAVSGTNCYCDEEAAARIREALCDLPLSGIHFLDSGNYHYLSRLWMGKVQEPFDLLLFDNHTDMQPPAFGGLLSCGGWVAAALEELPLLQQVFLVGPPRADCEQICGQEAARVTYVCREQLKALRRSGRLAGEGAVDEKLWPLDAEISPTRPLYLSVDKDILSEESGRMSWSQGDMSLSELVFLLKGLKGVLEKRGIPLLAADICGEWDGQENQEAHAALNDEANRALLEVLRGFSL